MRILITNHHLDNYAGSELFALDLAKELKKRDNKIFIFSPLLGKVAKEFQEKDIIITDDIKVIKNEKFDVIHAQHNITAILARSVFPKVPMIFMVHGIL